MTGPGTRIAAARTAADVAAAASLFRAYAVSLEIDLSYQGFEAELAALPGSYAPPGGELLLARAGRGGAAVGCVAFRPFPAAGACEMKRLYVAPGGRGTGLGRALAEAAIRAAGRAGYREMRLDTLPSMPRALALYRDLGFEEADPSHAAALPGTIFMRRLLAPAGDR